MKALIGGLLTVALLTAETANAQSAKLTDPAGVTGPEIVSWLQDRGYKAVLTKDGTGDPRIESATGGTNFRVYFYGCTAGRCSAIQFSAAFDLKNGIGAAAINKWNAENRYMRAYTDDDSDPWVESDINLDGGRTMAGLNADLDMWTTHLPDFVKYIDF